MILWDLDGTLTDPKPGITGGVQYALRSMGIEIDDPDTLTAYIGPPLRDAFHENHGIPVGDLESVVAAYREYYIDRGLFENRVIDGIPELLCSLSDADIPMAIATSKPDWMAETILKHFGLRGHFSFVGGATMDGSRGTKSEVLEHTLANVGIGDDPDERAAIVIIGDREHDILAAHEAGIASIGVRWGYAEPGELEAAAPTAIAGSVVILAQLLD